MTREPRKLLWIKSVKLGYDAKIDTYRTPEINLVFAYIDDLSMDSEVFKNGTSQNSIEKSRLVAESGLEPETSGLWILCSNQLSYPAV